MTHQENLISAQIDGGLHEKQALLDDFAKAAVQSIISTMPLNKERSTVLNLKEAIIKKVDELILKGGEVCLTPSYTIGFEIGEISAFRSTALENTVFVEVLGATMPLGARGATVIYDYLERCYHKRLEKEASRKREEALKYLGVS